MARARGANAVMALAFETSYGVPPFSGFFTVPFVSSQLGEEQGLIASDLLGQGRDPADPSPDVINDTGDVVIPVDARNIGHWLKALCGAPTTTQGVAATGSFAFSAQPTNNGTITVGTSAWTFVTGTPTGDESQIGATLLDTLIAAVEGLNASATSDFAACKFELALDGKTVNVTYGTVGTAGNSVALAASSSPASHATASGADLAGGSASGPYNHVFASGAEALPSLSVEQGYSDVPNYAMNYGIVANKLTINLARSGNLSATLSCIAQGESPNTPTSAAGTPTAYAVLRFAQFSGSVTRAGVQLGDLVSGNFSFDNGYDTVDIIRKDGRIGGADPGEAAYTGQSVLRFKDTVLRDLASNGIPVDDLTYKWTNGAFSLAFAYHRVFLPKSKFPITGPGAIQATYNWQGAKDTNVGRACTITLVNDVASYA
ncbi:MAG TPA: phage tail tube protein [Rhizomicrobium sp.]|jgi:hypothetical protein